MKRFLWLAILLAVFVACAYLPAAAKWADALPEPWRTSIMAAAVVLGVTCAIARAVSFFRP